jgi:hypothetical protein
LTLTVDSHPMVHIASRIAVAKKPRTTWGQKGAKGTREGNGGKRTRAHTHAHSLVHNNSYTDSEKCVLNG